MIISINRLTNPVTSIAGLRDSYSPGVNYQVGNLFLDMQADSSVTDRVLNIVSSGQKGTYNNYPVYNDVTYNKIFVDLGLSYPRLQELIPATSQTAPPTTDSCPCNNCREEIVPVTYYASKEQLSPTDIPISMTRDIVICEPNDDGSVTSACADELARVKAAAGINGLSGTVYTMSPAKKKCIEGCRGLPESQWNSCLDKCNGIAFNPTPNLSGTASSAWGSCATKCNSQRLGQADLQKCYAACPTGGIIAPSNTGYSVSPSGSLVSSYKPIYANLSGLSNDSSVVDDVTPIYTTDSADAMYLPAQVPCEKGNSNTLWFIIIGGACTILGYIIAQALKKR